MRVKSLFSKQEVAREEQGAYDFSGFYASMTSFSVASRLVLFFFLLRLLRFLGLSVGLAASVSLLL